MVSKVIVHVARGIAAGDALAAEEHVFVRDVSGGVGLIKRVRAHAVPIELAVGFRDALAVAVVSVGNSGGGRELVFGVVDVSVWIGTGGASAGIEHVAGRVVAVAGNPVGGGGGDV